MSPIQRLSIQKKVEERVFEHLAVKEEVPLLLLLLLVSNRW